MADPDAGPSMNLRPRRTTRHSVAASHRDRTVSSSDAAADSSLLAVPSPDSHYPRRSDDDVEPLPQSSPRLDTSHDDSNKTKRRSKGAARSHNKHRSFLLSDPIANSADDGPLTHSKSQRRHRDVVVDVDGRSSQVQEARAGTARGLEQGGERANGGARHSMGSATTKRNSSAGTTAVGSSSPASIDPLDVDSAQIVKMALNLSESRRLASRRNVSQPMPPRLAPLPDATTGGSLRQHLQQQRRVSRTISPKPDRSPRIGASRIASPLQSSFDSEGSYRYVFSESTLARAQKAKEYLELMAQYRRVLAVLPPLKPSRTARSSTTSPPSSPGGSQSFGRSAASFDSDTHIGRPYDPLQYIRNRKVRARERKVIDGEAQGFNDIVKVSEWTDDVSKWIATEQNRIPGNPALPPFHGADFVDGQGSPPSVNPGAPLPSKPKRPRVDWCIEPADMLADVYWLEQNDNKKLVEDRQWRRVFPQDAELYRPLSMESSPPAPAPGSAKGQSGSHAATERVSTESFAHKSDHEKFLSTARDRAQKKLKALRGSHRHTHSIHKGLHIHRGSLSESTDTDSDFTRRGRAGTITSPGKAILAKQMDEMIAKEQKEMESHPLYDHEALRMKFGGSSLMTPERDRPRNSPGPSRAPSHRRRESEMSEAEGHYVFKMPPRPSPPEGHGRVSLEVPTRPRRASVDYDTSQPNSPDLRPLRDSGFVPAFGMDLSPMSSRPPSPSRNPLTRVKGIFRERSKDRSDEMKRQSNEDMRGAPVLPMISGEMMVDSPIADWSGSPMPAFTSSRNPSQAGTPPTTHKGHRPHRSLSSIKLRGEDGTGLRSLFRGPRIDSVLRTSVSKVSDLIWRKESGGASDEDSSSTSSDDSETDDPGRGRQRGRSKASVLPPPVASKAVQDTAKKNQFLSPTSFGSPSSPDHPSSRPLSRRSSRFELLKPPRIDVQSASPTSASPPPEIDAPTPSSHNTDAVRAANAHLHAALSIPKPPHHARTWSAFNARTPTPPTVLSRREIARIRTLLLTFGIHAMEFDRRARQPRALNKSHLPSPNGDGPSTDLATLCPEPVAQADLYPLLSRTLAASLQSSAQDWQSAAASFSLDTAPALERRVDDLRARVAGELTDQARAAAEAAEEAGHDMAVRQRLKVKRVGDMMDKLLRRRRRRFRWLRRGLWLGVEWLLVGFMWYVWFVVMIARVVLGMFKGVGRLVRWLVWL